jgi:hypothetical protein
MTMTRAQSATGVARSVVRSAVAVVAGVLMAAGCATMGGHGSSKASVPMLSQSQVANRPFVKVNAVQSPASCSQGGDDVTTDGMRGLQVEAAKANADALVNVSCGEGDPTATCAHTYVCHGDAIRWSQDAAGNTSASQTVGG